MINCAVLSSEMLVSIKCNVNYDFASSDMASFEWCHQNSSRNQQEGSKTVFGILTLGGFGHS